MYFNSMQYALFFLAVLAIYYLLPRKVRYIWLTIASYLFYMKWNASYAFLMLCVTGITYIAAILLEHTAKSSKTGIRKAILAVSLILDFAFLLYFKYTNFIIDNLSKLNNHFGGRTFSTLDIVLPIGISFYVFQAAGYVIDVYRKNVRAEYNPIRYALFISFFPQLEAGPIGRSTNLLSQLHNPGKLTGNRLRSGLIRILIGVWQKVAIADVISEIIAPIFNEYQNYQGCTIALAVILYGIQIYCDFGGYSNIAIGSAQILGIDLMENFNSPYLAANVRDFWRRWHISLTSWFRDYLYIPLGGNRKGKIRKYINTLIVFLVSGLWHGAAWNYIFWGLLNGVMIVGSNILSKKKRRKPSATRLDLMGKRVFTFLLINFTWLFFRVPRLQDAINMIVFSVKSPGFRYFLHGDILNCFGSIQVFAVLLLSIGILYLMGLVKEKHGDFIAYLSQQKAIYRWAFYLILFLIVVIYGAYGEGYEQTEFIYFQF